MNHSLIYLDSSAILKLVVSEPESNVLFATLNQWPERVSSELARTEVLRSLRRAGVTAPQFRRGQKILGRIGMIPIDTRILSDAALLKPASLRSLDAIHLATALSLGKDIAGIVSYDSRLSDAAASANLKVWSPAA